MASSLGARRLGCLALGVCYGCHGDEISLGILAVAHSTGIEFRGDDAGGGAGKAVGALAARASVGISSGGTNECVGVVEVDGLGGLVGCQGGYVDSKAGIGLGGVDGLGGGGDGAFEVAFPCGAVVGCGLLVGAFLVGSAFVLSVMVSCGFVLGDGIGRVGVVCVAVRVVGVSVDDGFMVFVEEC